MAKKAEVSKKSFKSIQNHEKITEFFLPSLLVYCRNEIEGLGEEFNFRFFDVGQALMNRKINASSLSKKGFGNDQIVECWGNGPDGLKFESRFESGNLSMAAKVSENEFNLLLQNDVNTTGNTQWFFFRVTGARAGQKVKFNILNLYKTRSLFKEGMQISLYSARNFENNKEGWFKSGQDISYTMNSFIRPNGKPHYTLSFTHEFVFDDDSVYFSYSVPYTYSNLLSLLDSFEKDSEVSKFLLRAPLCRTIGGNIVYLLTITSPSTREDLKNRLNIFISARIHPGETVSSHIMHGFLKFITGNNEEAHALRKKFIFKVVPMLNPDGVVNGNNRCSLLGVDLNRRWKKPNLMIHPEIFCYKKLIENTYKKSQIGLICDFHGHSIKHNIFAYGCNHLNSPHLCKAFPYLLSHNSDFFSFPDCSFSISSSKSRTLRVVMFRELGINNTFTVEASFCGNNFGKYKNFQLSIKMLQKFGTDFAKCLLSLEDCLNLPVNFFDFQQQQSLKELSQASKSLHQPSKPDPAPSLQTKLQDLARNEKILRTGESSSSGSDSGESDDNLNDQDFLKSFRKARKVHQVVQSSKNLVTSRCKNCGKLDYPGHVCVILFRNSKIKAFRKSVLASVEDSEVKGESKKYKVSRSQMRLSESPSRPLIKESISKGKLVDSTPKLNIGESPSKSRLNDSTLRAGYLVKVRSESVYKSTINRRNSTIGKTRDASPVLEPHLYQAYSENKVKVHDFHYFDKQSEVKGLKSVANIKGVHLLGIIEGIQCKLQKFSKNKMKAK